MPIAVKIKVPMKTPVQQVAGTPPLVPDNIPSDFYLKLSPDVVTEAQEAAVRIRARAVSAKNCIVEIGNDLLTIKEKLDHGQFGAWLAHEFSMSIRTAQRYMAAAKELGEISDAVSGLPSKLLHILSAPSTPDDVKKAVLAEIEAGATPTLASVAEQVKLAKAAEPANIATSAVIKSQKQAAQGAAAAKAGADMEKAAHNAAEQAVAFLQEHLGPTKCMEFAILHGKAHRGHFSALLDGLLDPCEEEHAG